MKLISPFKDYYDYALSFGTENHPVYIRKTDRFFKSSLEKGKELFPHGLPAGDTLREANVKRKPTVLTSSAYHQPWDTPFYLINKNWSPRLYFCGKYIDLFWIGDEWKVNFSSVNQKKMAQYERLYGEKFLNSVEVAKENKFKDCDMGVFYAAGVPCFLTRWGHRIYKKRLVPTHRQILRNPKLMGSGIESIMDAMEAYTLLRQTLENGLAPKEPVSQVTDDVVLRDAKGFDKWSFKQQGPKNRKSKKDS